MREVEGALCSRIAAGDEEALADVFETYGALMYGLARRVTGSSTMAEDVVQEVLVGLWRSPGRFDPARGSLRGFLSMQAHCRALDAVRSDARRTAVERQHDRLEGADRGRAEDAAGEVQAQVVATLVRDAIRRLPADQREVVELAYFGGHSHQEVAAALGIPLGTAKGRLRLAHAKLRSLLGPAMVEPA